MHRVLPVIGFCLLLAASAASGQGAYGHFEARHTHPAGLSPDGTRLFVLNSPDARLSVFDISNPANPAPLLIAEIPVGLEPVSLKARTSDEVWVVNEVSDSVSVVSVSRHAVIETLRTPDEPADIVFANGRAFVSCARNNQIRVFDAITRQPAATIPVDGLYPRALAANASGTRVFAAFQLSGNGTTILPAAQSPAPPAPTNASLPAAPQTALIVPAGDSRITYSVTNHDVAEIDTATLSVTGYLPSIGTNLFDLAVNPQTGSLWVVNTEALNLVRFEPALRGHFVENRLSIVPLPGGPAAAFDLNPGIDYQTLPNPAAAAAALAQPSALAMAPDGGSAWIAAFGSDRIARVSANGTVGSRIDLRPASEDSRRMRGPRGLAWDTARQRLYVLNKLANSVSVVDTAAGTLLTEIPAGTRDPMPADVKAGRGFLFDARLSGNGTVSCASCHLDADRDGMAWDLGDPGGKMMTVKGQNLSVHDLTVRDRVLHPMKGPMTTQTLRGLQNGAPFHWRGDRPALQSFNGAFNSLMGGTELAEPDIDALAAYLVTIRHHPNPNRNTDRSLPVLFNGGNPTRGRTLFNNHVLSHCAICHTLPTGSDNNIDLMSEVGSSQPVKTVGLGTVYQRSFFRPVAGQTSLSGFGLLHDGTGFALPSAHPYPLSQIEEPADFTDLAAFILCFDTGTAPAIGYTKTVTADNANAGSTLADVGLLEGQALLLACDLAVSGTVGGKTRAFVYDAALQIYRSDRTGDPEYTKFDLFTLLAPGDALTFMGVPPGDGPRYGGDRDADGIPDGDTEAPPLFIDLLPDGPRLRWPQISTDWFPEFTQNPAAPWNSLTTVQSAADGWLFTRPGFPGRTFFRLRKTW